MVNKSCPLRQKQCMQKDCMWYVNEYCCTSNHKESGICSMKYCALKNMKGFKNDWAR